MKKSIVYIFSYPEGGIGTHIIDIIKSPISRNYNIILISNFDKKDKKFDYFLNNCKENIELFDLNITKTPTLRDIINIIKLFNLLRKRKDIVIFHGHGAKGGLYSRILGKILNKKTIYTPHGGSLHLNYGKFKNFIFIIIEKVLYFLTDKLIFESKYSFKQYENNIIKDYMNKSIINYNGVEIKNCECETKEKIKDNIIIDSYGSLRKLKGHDILIKSIYKLLRTNKDISLKVRIFGKGEEENNLLRLINYYGLSEIVELYGYVEDVSIYLKECDIVVHPSRIESLPYILLESMNFCKPIVASNVGGISEIIIHKYNGLLFEKENEVELASFIELLIRDIKLANKISKNARNTVIKNFSKDRMIEKLLKIYKELER